MEQIIAYQKLIRILWVPGVLDPWTMLDRTEQIVYRRTISHWNQSRFQWSLLGPSQIQGDPWIILDRTEQIVYKVPSRKWAICGNGGKKPLTCRKNCFWGPFGSLGPPPLLQGVPGLDWTEKWSKLQPIRNLSESCGSLESWIPGLCWTGLNRQYIEEQ